ncbi:Transposon Tf2-6 polyprotein [Lucilia cuprina]|nr:Transposon Tf2-6 polyprotein [Lucilia cuprina]
MAQTYNFLKPPKPLVIEHDKDMAKEWKLWRQQYEYYEVATGLNTKPANIQFATFMSAIGHSAIQIYNSLPGESSDTLTTVKTKFETYFTPKLNTTFERYKFHKIIQNDGETIDEYITRFLLRDQLILGIKSDTLRTKLLSDDITLAKALQICQATELAQKQTAEIHNENDKSVNLVQKFNKTKSFDCRNCGNNHTVRNCPAYRHICKKCKKKNHFETMCRTKQKKKFNKNRDRMYEVAYCEQQEHTESCTDSDPELFIGCIINSNKENESFIETINIENNYYDIKLDTGAQCNVLPKSVIDELKVTNKQITVKPCRVKHLVSFGNHKMKVIGEVLLTCKIAQKKCKINFKIVNENVKPILGADSCESLQLVKRVQELQINENLFEGLGCIKNFVYDIDLVRNPKFEICPARRVAFKIRDQVKNELDKMVKMNVIEPTNLPTPAVSPMVVVRKNNKIRICLDPTSVNKNIKRRHYPMNTLEEISAQLKGAKFFSILDCKKGFWQIPVTDRTKQILTFSTPWGRYSCKRLPFGISSAPEVFQSLMQQLFSHLPNVKVAIDDILVHSKNLNELRATTNKVINIIENNGLKLNKEKCKFEQSQVKFLGHVISDTGLRPDPEKIDAVNRLKPPNNKKELQRVLGKFTYLSKFIKNFSHITAPLRALLEKSNTFYWDTVHQQSFDHLKQMISKPPVLKLYDVNKDVKLQVDSSSYAMGAVLLQDDQPVAYASKSLTESQSRYSQLEKEALAVKFGCEKFHQYVWGKFIIIESDHKPLESIFKKPIHASPTRLQKIRLSLLTYNPKVIYKPGIKMYLADPLSRDCINDKNEEIEDNLEIQTILSISDNELEIMKKETKNDSVCQTLLNFIRNGWPKTKEDLPAEIKLYWHFRDELSTNNDGIIFKSTKVFVPVNLRENFLKNIHTGHFSYAKCVRMARESVFWPHMSQDIFNFVKKCAACQVYQRKNTKIKIGEKEIPTHGFEIGATDLFNFKNNEYIVFIDSYSGYLKFKKLNETTSKQVILFLKEIFSTFGPPLTLETDNGPQFSSSEFKLFSSTWKFNHRTSSPYHPSGNGLAERAVQIAKNILKKSTYDSSDYHLGLLNYMNTPRGNLGSPSQRLFGHGIRSTLPTSKETLLLPESKRLAEHLKQQRDKQNEYANRGANYNPQHFIEGDTVVTRTENERTWKPAVVKTQIHPRSYVVEDENGNQYRRNSQHIRHSLAKITSTPEVVTEKEHVDSESPYNTTQSTTQQPPPALRRSSRTKVQPQRLQIWVYEAPELDVLPTTVLRGLMTHVVAYYQQIYKSVSRQSCNGLLPMERASTNLKSKIFLYDNTAILSNLFIGNMRAYLGLICVPTTFGTIPFSPIPIMNHSYYTTSLKVEAQELDHHLSSLFAGDRQNFLSLLGTLFGRYPLNIEMNYNILQVKFKDSSSNSFSDIRNGGTRYNEYLFNHIIRKLRVPQDSSSNRFSRIIRLFHTFIQIKAGSKAIKYATAILTIRTNQSDPLFTKIIVLTLTCLLLSDLSAKSVPRSPLARPQFIPIVSNRDATVRNGKIFWINKILAFLTGLKCERSTRSMVLEFILIRCKLPAYARSVTVECLCAAQKTEARVQQVFILDILNITPKVFVSYRQSENDLITATLCSDSNSSMIFHLRDENDESSLFMQYPRSELLQLSSLGYDFSHTRCTCNQQPITRKRSNLTFIVRIWDQSSWIDIFIST